MDILESANVGVAVFSKADVLLVASLIGNVLTMHINHPRTEFIGLLILSVLAPILLSLLLVFLVLSVDFLKAIHWLWFLDNIIFVPDFKNLLF